MKIHHIINSYDTGAGGAENLVRNIHKYLIKNKIKSSIFGLIHSDININNCENAGLKSPYNYRAFLSIKRYCDKNVHENDIIHSHLFPANLFCSIIKMFKLTRATLITTEHSTHNRRRGKIWGKILDLIIYTPCKSIISISLGVKNELINWIPTIKTKVLVIENGCLLYHKTPITRKKKIGPVQLVSVGALKDAKNYKVVIDSMNEIRNLDFVWSIAGDGYLKNNLLSQVNKLGLNEKIIFLGHTNDVWPLLEKSDIFIMGSKWEGFGLAAVEAMNSSLPIIVSDVPGLKEVAKHKLICALFIDPLNKLDIAEKTRRMILDYDLRTEFGLNSFKNSKKFDESRMFKSYINFYNKLVNTLN